MGGGGQGEEEDLYCYDVVVGEQPRGGVWLCAVGSCALVSLLYRIVAGRDSLLIVCYISSTPLFVVWGGGEGERIN